MTKKDLVNAVAERSGIERTVVESVINSALNETKVAVVSGKTLYVRGFGTLGPKHRAQKIGQDIRSGQQVVIPAQILPAFKPSRVFKAEVNQGRILKANQY